MTLVRILWEDFRMWCRGMKRVAPRFDVNGRVIRGRIYARRHETGTGQVQAKTKVVGRMSLRVYRAATQTWDDPVDVGPIVKEVR